MRITNLALLLGASKVLAAPQVQNAQTSKCAPPVTVTSTVYLSSVSASSKASAAAEKIIATKSTSSSSSIATGLPSTDSSAPPTNQKSTAGTYRNVLYFTNWGIYGAQTFPRDIPAEKLTHVLYAFGDINGAGEVISSDSWADVEKEMPGQKIDWSSPKKTAYGCVGQLYQLKQKNRNLKILLSIGGWTYSQSGKFKSPASTDAGRKKFADTAVKIMADWGFDGLDIDWEYPENKEQGQNFVRLLQACRVALDNYAKKYKQSYHYELTVAASAGASHYNLQDLKGMDRYIDAWHLMTYDYAGGWDTTTGHQANVFKDPKNPLATKFNSDSAVRDYISRGISPSKIVFGLPLYGRAFGNAQGLGKPFSGPGKGPLEAGMWLYKDLPRPGAKSWFDSRTGATHSYDYSTKELVSFDGPKSANFKAKYIIGKGLGGSFFWDASGDKKGDQSLVGIMAKSFQGRMLKKQNMLSYPQSQYDNIKNG